MLDSLFYTGTESVITVGNLLIALAAALVFGVINSLIYLKAGKNKSPSASFSITLVVLPAVVTVIILLVGNNVARAFSLAGAFTIIRFRSAPGDPKDITYVLFSMAIGLACGMGYIAYAAVAALLLCGVMGILELTGFGQAKEQHKLLKIMVPEMVDYTTAFSDVFQKYTASHRLVRLKTAELGSLYQLSYDISTKKDTNEKDFIDELRCRNGNLNISLSVYAAEFGTEKT